jgi:hypothetical protein
VNSERKSGVLRLSVLSRLVVASILVLAEVVEGTQDGHAVGTPTSDHALSSLTEEERAWLRDHPVIRVVQDPA